MQQAVHALLGGGSNLREAIPTWTRQHDEVDAGLQERLKISVARADCCGIAKGRYGRCVNIVQRQNRAVLMRAHQLQDLCTAHATAG
ncbi:hypothetical protein LBMAG49_21490 [Planctomycetota bacterium]|nr:hypothetical protein LBMAG49_21490 [Planctomycetota bacterium]